MRNFVKYGLVAFAGYLVGFYEMKYKVMEVLLQETSKKKVDKKEDEAQ